MLNIRTKASGTNGDGHALELSKLTWQLKQFQCLFERDGLDALVLWHLGETRLLVVVGSTDLSQRTELSDFHQHGSAGLRILAEDALAGLMLGTRLHDLVDSLLKRLVKLAHHVLPLLFSLSDLIELVLDLRREVVVHDLGEVLQKEVVDHDADVGGDKLSFL